MIGLGKRRQRNIHQRYLLALILPAVVVTTVFSANYLFLKNAGEYAPVSEIVDRQLKYGGVYNSGVGDLTYEYKLALYQRVRPKVAVIGSSRAMQFHGAPFKARFVNLGGAMNHLGEGEILIDDMLARHQPEIVIVVLDFWWFNSAWKEPESSRLRGLNQRRFLLGHLYKPLLWLVDGKVSPATYLRVLKNDVQDIGTQAVVWQDGYDRFGATHYPSRVDGSRPHQHKRFRPSLKMVRDGSKGFVAGGDISPARIARLNNLLVKLREADIAAITILPPLAPPVLNAMKAKGGYDYIARLQRDLAKLSKWHVDAHDPQHFGSDACEFLDGTHGGAVTYLRILKAAIDLPWSPLRKYLNADALETLIATNSGHAALRYPQGSSPEEVDFLELGCKKPRDRQSE